MYHSKIANTMSTEVECFFSKFTELMPVQNQYSSTFIRYAPKAFLSSLNKEGPFYCFIKDSYAVANPLQFKPHDEKIF